MIGDLNASRTHYHAIYRVLEIKPYFQYVLRDNLPKVGKVVTAVKKHLKTAVLLHIASILLVNIYSVMKNDMYLLLLVQVFYLILLSKILATYGKKYSKQMH